MDKNSHNIFVVGVIGVENNETGAIRLMIVKQETLLEPLNQQTMTHFSLMRNLAGKLSVPCRMKS